MITDDRARAVALALPQVEEHAHQGHPDFRVRGKVFLSLRPEERRAAVKLALVDHAVLLATDPDAFATNSWSKVGWLDVLLEHVDPERFREVVEAAWCTVAPARLVTRYEAEKRNR